MYKSKLTVLETQDIIRSLRHRFEENLCDALNLRRVSAPLFVSRGSGINDDLNGVERPVSFDILQTGEVVEVVHSLAKWKRAALGKYGFSMHTGLYTDMNAIRRDEVCDSVHSLYVDLLAQMHSHHAVGSVDGSRSRLSVDSEREKLSLNHRVRYIVLQARRCHKRQHRTNHVNQYAIFQFHCRSHISNKKYHKRPYPVSLSAQRATLNVYCHTHIQVEQIKLEACAKR